MPVGCTWVPVRGLGVGAVGVGQVTQALSAAAQSQSFKWLIGSVLAGTGATVIGNMLGGPDTEDSWKDRTVFNDRMRAMHAGFLMVQCEVGGSQQAYGCDDNNRCLCPANTQPKCRLPEGKLNEWRALRNGFSDFYAEVGGADWFGSDWLVLDPSDADVAQARAYARKLVKFYVDLPSICPGYRAPFNLASIVAPEQGSTAEQVAQANLRNLAVEQPWVRGARYVAITVGVIGVIWVGTTLKDAFRKR